mmetsp:Transcript_10958/g.21450  ORF Transcript_10958/g.21450 Transcript_10958/m.21450 type:complete len:236 (-) Transcript_10958:167-874(-)
MFKLSDLTAHSNSQPVTANPLQFNEVFQLQLSRLAPCSIQALGKPVHGDIAAREQVVAGALDVLCNVNQATKTLLTKSGKVKKPIESVELSPPNKSQKDQPIKHNELKPSIPCPKAPKKRSMTELTQPATDIPMDNYKRAPRPPKLKESESLKGLVKVQSRTRRDLQEDRPPDSCRRANSKHQRTFTEGLLDPSDNSYMLALFNMGKAELSSMKRTEDAENTAPPFRPPQRSSRK